MKTTKKMRPSPIPEFQSYEEEAEFWDTHSPEDFPDEFEDAPDITFATPLEIVWESDRGDLISALAELGESERQVVTLSMLGLYPDEIARVMGWSTTDCQKALRAARRKARTLGVASER
jgi:DNA-directed RNA polymerase specialized sigma24 family protein